VGGSLRTYACINARLRARISKMLPEEFMQQLERTRSLPECIQQLRDTAYGAVEPAYRGTGDVRMAELAFYGEEIRMYLDLESMAGGTLRRFIEALVARFEIDTLKNALRLWFDARVRKHAVSGAAGYLYRERIHYDLNLDAIVNAEDLTAVAQVLEKTPYGQIVEALTEEVEERQSLFPLEVALDRFYYERLVASINRLGLRDRRVARRIIGVEIDWVNVMWIMRVKRFYADQPEDFTADIVPGGAYLTEPRLRGVETAEEAEALLFDVVRHHYRRLSEQLESGPVAAGLYPRLARLEDLLAEIHRTEARRALCGYPFTVGIILAYFVLKEAEIQRLVALLNAKAYGEPQPEMEAIA